MRLGLRSARFFGSALLHSDLVLQQYLYARLGGAGLNRALLLSLATGKGGMVYPLPRAWQRVLILHGVRVARGRSTLLFVGYVVLLWLYGVTSIGRQVIRSVSHRWTEANDSQVPYAYLANIGRNSLPVSLVQGRSYDFASWYGDWEGRDPEVQEIRHSVRGASDAAAGSLACAFTSEAIPPTSQPRACIAFVFWSAAAVVVSACQALVASWAQAFLLAEASLASRARNMAVEGLARDYLLPNSVTIYRPLWTYEAEARGSRVFSYFYSTGEQFKLPTGYEAEHQEWGGMNWPRYLVWDVFQADLIRRVTSPSTDVRPVGPIWFQDGPEAVPESAAGSVAVFDIQPPRTSYHFGFSTILDLYRNHPEVAVTFLRDVHMVLRERGVAMSHKLKRKAGYQLHPRYRTFIKQLETEPDYVPIEPQTSAFRLIERCEAVVSFPFTSTGVVALHMGKPTAFYDPLGVIQPDDRAAHGVPILRGVDELRIWLGRIVTGGSR